MGEERSAHSTAGMWQELQLRDYWKIARRRKWWIILTATSISVGTGVVAARLPNIYRSNVVVVVEPQKVPDNYVSSVVTSSLQDRLPALEQQVMSPVRLKRLIDTMGLYRELKGRLSSQAIIALMQKSTTIQVSDPGEHAPSSFSITFRGTDPIQTAQVANELAAVFVEQNLKVREQNSYGTAEFLNSELQETKRQLDQKEEDIQRIKSQYILDLPESKQFHLESLNNLRNQLRESQDRVSRAQQEEMLLESMAANTAPTVDLDSGQTSRYQSEIQKLESRLSELRSRYGTNYPDVRKVQSELDRLGAKAAIEEKRSAPPAEASNISSRTRRNPVVEAQVQKLNDEIAEHTKQQAQLQQQINFHVSKLERIPVFEQRIAGMMRDYDTLQNHHHALLDKKFSAEMASSLETRQKAERFLILEPAPVPEKPVAPNRILIVLAGLTGGLLGGLGLAIVVEAADESVRDEREAAGILGKPILAAIPYIRAQSEAQRNKVRWFGIVAGAVACSGALGFLVSKLIWPLL